VSLDGEYTNYYHFDALGSTRLLTNSSGAVTDTYTYDAWGGVSQGGSTVQPYQFVGQLGYYFPIQDENFPLLQLGVRFYDPAQTGRFTQRDVMDDMTNHYWYGNDLPTTLVDPSGLMHFRVPILPLPPFVVPAGQAMCNLYRCFKCDRSQPGWDMTPVPATPRNPHGPRNAVGHCIRACNMTKNCQEECAGMGGPEWYLNGPYEWWNRPPMKRNRDMDIHNNNAGIDCAKKGQDCVQCCMTKYKKGDVTWF